MKNWIKRFGMLAVLGSMVGGILVAGCGGGGDEEETTTETKTEKKKTGDGDE